jgi:hypothetical protein
MAARPILGALLAAPLLIGALPAQSSTPPGESLVWAGKASGAHVALTYGPLDSAKQPVFLLSCFNGMDVAVLEVFGAIEGKRPGQKLTIELSAGSAQSPLDGEASVDEKTGAMFAEASDIALAPVLDVLRSPGPLTIKMGSTSRTLSDAGRAEAVAKFGKDCEID